ncbi:maf protein [Thermosinus carboxydivorans Nor1]|uniref:dTTP/UTP pyrophosphatase n=1 Tax=Thermosinus carboxydivorans Nor1 TaxID=401526 RepID=A1HP06_9FIRM|nr:Maf family protein [Thermosinus carboxydivorans]EAX48114.1 maf protein [Thermosinus carboxydivorans Nor1]
MGIILASASPRRQELLRQVGCQFEVVVSDVIEDNEQSMAPAELAVTQATAKALDVATKVSCDRIVVGADTIVVLEGQVYGKPVDADDARRMLTDLSGKEHQVITGVAVVKGQNVWTDFAVTSVRMRNLSAVEIERYIATGEPMDKAGAYAIQGKGALLVEGISGCYANVVGLPLVTLARLLDKAGVELL